MKQVQTKMITVESRGFVMTSRGKVVAPIRTPYRESVDRIWSMITQDRADVTEHIGGRRIPLTVLNFDTDNSAVPQKEAAPVAPETVSPNGGAKVVSDIKVPNDGVHMRTGDVFSTDPSKTQNHHNPTNDHAEANADEQTSEEKTAVDEVQKEAAPVAPETTSAQNTTGADKKTDDRSNQNNNNQQGNKNKNNQNNGKNKHGKNKGNNNQNRNNQNTNEKKDENSEATTNTTEQVPEEKTAEPTTGSDLAVIPENV